MKKFLVGVLCCVGLLIVTIVSSTELAVNDKPEITSIGVGKSI
ncbi:hypothetical protein [Psychrobacillus vulpis]|nr:hypothetical protein [Psychrobacillus vulpis]